MSFDHFRLLSREDLEEFRVIVLNHLRQAGIGLPRLSEYHKYVSNEAHAHIFSRKSVRVLSPGAVNAVFRLPSMLSLCERFPCYSLSKVISDQGEADTAEVYFRLVRPNCPDDVGSPHCDRWFHEVYGLHYRASPTWKVWIALEVEPGLSGLQFFPHAEVDAIEWNFKDSKLLCDPNQACLGSPHLPNVEPGDALLFDSDTLHQGVLNRGSLSRVSVELTYVPQ